MMARFFGAALGAFAAAAASGIAVAEDYVPTEVQLDPRGYGWLLTDTSGMTLYTYTRDQEPGKSRCNDDCAAVWPPLKAPAGATGKGDWSTLSRDDGTLQWAFKDKPLYTFSRDVAPGDINGDANNRQWYIATKSIETPPGFQTFNTPHGYLLADLDQMTLYVSSADKANESLCNDVCARTWLPVEAFWSAEPIGGDWTVVTRKDGTKQWAYKSQPLYRYVWDARPSDIEGDGVDGHEAVVLEPRPPIPDWITFQISDGGELLADARGKTIYEHHFIPGGNNGFIPRADDGMDRPYDWEPLVAEAGAQPVGQWSIVVHDDGTRQWAHKGRLLYTNKRDDEPGALNGVRSTDRIWRPIMKSGQTMPGTGV